MWLCLAKDLVNIVTPNESEAEPRTGITVSDEASAAKAGSGFRLQKLMRWTLPLREMHLLGN